MLSTNVSGVALAAGAIFLLSFALRVEDKKRTYRIRSAAAVGGRGGRCRVQCPFSYTLYLQSCCIGSAQAP